MPLFLVLPLLAGGVGFASGFLTGSKAGTVMKVGVVVAVGVVVYKQLKE